MRPIKRIVTAIGAGLLGAILAAAPAAAHVTANPNEGRAGGFAFHEFRVGHGCGDSPTTEVSIQIPEEVVSVTPEVQPGWEIELIREDRTGEEGGEQGGNASEGTHGRAAQEEDEGDGDEEDGGGHGAAEEARVTEVRWHGGLLPSDRVDHFGLSVRYAEGIDGDAAFFPTVQTCEEGELAWIEVPGEGEDPQAFFGEAESPAPFVLLSAGEGGHGGGADDGEDSEEVALDGEPAADSDDSDTLAIVALIVGALGLVAGVGGFVRAGRRAQA